MYVWQLRHYLSMKTIVLRDLVRLQNHSIDQSVFVLSRGESTFMQVNVDAECNLGEVIFWASPTPLCGVGSLQYSPFYIMAVLSVTPLSDVLETLNKIELPKVLFITHPNVRRSMTLNAMRMTTELFGLGSERVYQLAKQRLEANQSDVVHDLMVYLMHVILDERRTYRQEIFLRAESIAAYLGISPQKVFVLMLSHMNNSEKLAASLEQGEAGVIRRQLDVTPLVENQMELLAPFQQIARSRETQTLEVMHRILEFCKMSD